MTWTSQHKCNIDVFHVRVFFVPLNYTIQFIHTRTIEIKMKWNEYVFIVGFCFSSSSRKKPTTYFYHHLIFFVRWCHLWPMVIAAKKKKKKRHYFCQNLYFHLVYILSSFSSKFASFSCVFICIANDQKNSVYLATTLAHTKFYLSRIIAEFLVCNVQVYTIYYLISPHFSPTFMIHEKFLDYEPVSTSCNCCYCCCFAGGDSNQIKISNLVPSINFIDFRIK